MNSIRKQLLVKTYSFNELLPLWRQGRFTLDEILTLIQRTLTSFRARAMRLDYKLLPLTDLEEADFLREEYVDMETFKLIAELAHDKSVAYRAVDHVLKQFSLLELRLYQMEQDFSEIEQELETVPFYFN